MNWEAIGAIAEVAGAIGVIATLVYLAIQIRESNRAALQSGTQEIQNQIQQFVGSTCVNREVSELWVKGHTTPNELTTGELIQFRGFLLQVTLIWERTFSLHNQNRLDAGYWETLALHRIHMISSPGYKSFFEDRKHQFNSQFREFMETEIASNTEEWRPLGVKV